jgi:AhpD family alkylhydroperoxidase
MTSATLLTTRTALTAFLLLGSAAASAAPESGRPAASPATAEARADIGRTLGFVPRFFLEFPPQVLPGTWDEMKTLQLNPKTALPGKVKELIGLGVAAQVPCKYCIIAHTELGRLNGASEAEIGEAVAMAAITRHWSTYLNGTLTDETKFRSDITQILANVKAASGKPAPAPVAVVDGTSALKDIGNTLGFVPDFLKRFPDSARAGAWRTMKEVQLNPGTALSGKNKELVGLAVASQVPCKFCVIAHTEFARLNGATDAEINEAIAMAAFTRHMSTLLNGAQVDEPQFRKDLDRLLRGARAAAAAARPRPAATTATATR